MCVCVCVCVCVSVIKQLPWNLSSYLMIHHNTISLTLDTIVVQQISRIYSFFITESLYLLINNSPIAIAIGSAVSVAMTSIWD